MSIERPSPHTYDRVEESKELSPKVQELITLYGYARNENDPEKQLELLRELESRLHELIEPEAHPFPLSDQSLREVMLHGVGDFLVGGGSQGQRIRFESERFNPGLESSDGKPKWMRYPQADTVGKEMYERFIEVFGSNCVDIAPEVKAEATGF
ncbi:MAG TPA: hypothetical protein VFT59_03650 [Candidatus Saccharimonadales bacterium]|nr:hypothetical protein [Candidatus Saccharimonadales bacterium]